jgi:hypothetical protein
MKRFMNKKVLVVGVAVALVLGIGGAAFAYFTSTGGGTGAAQVGTASNLIINQLGTPVYDSTYSPLPGNVESLSYGGTNTTEFGNEITLLPSVSPLQSVVVDMSSWACEAGNWTGLDNSNNPTQPCVTSPGATFTTPITLNIYSPGDLSSPIATDTQIFTIPYRPSTDPIHCPGSPATAWYDTANDTCYHGYSTQIVFDLSSENIVLPSTVVYGIAYDASSGPASSLNVELSTEPTDISVGSDTDPGNVFLAVGPGSNDAGPGEVTCSTANGTFAQYPTACGLGSTYNIPAVQFNVSSMGDLFPGGPAQPINFSVTNPGVGDEYVNSVTISISSFTNQHPTLLSPACESSWFQITGPTAPVGVDLAPGTTYYYSDASIAMPENNIDEDACQGATVNLTFTSS